MNTIKRKNDMPEDDIQFVAIWLWDGTLWGRTFVFLDSDLYEYNQHANRFDLAEGYADLLNHEDTRFFIL